ncbi:MAG: hypothetical protein BWY95_01810 [Bacteroidetes bacterium ADurb.BinA104]|nr:MAG: hypothetical protein BWY95_01810 [Bacteroidetes bacterium ADurb.BinA104]
MDGQDGFDGFDLYDYLIKTEKINLVILAEPLSFISDVIIFFPFVRDVHQLKLKFQSIRVYSFQKNRSRADYTLPSMLPRFYRSVLHTAS